MKKITIKRTKQSEVMYVYRTIIRKYIKNRKAIPDNIKKRYRELRDGYS